MVQLSHPYMTIGKTIALTRRTYYLKTHEPHDVDSVNKAVRSRKQCMIPVPSLARALRNDIKDEESIAFF